MQERRNSSALAMELRLSCTNPSICWPIDRLVQERRNSSALAMELHLSCTNPSIWYHMQIDTDIFSKPFNMVRVKIYIAVLHGIYMSWWNSTQALFLQNILAVVFSPRSWDGLWRKLDAIQFGWRETWSPYLLMFPGWGCAICHRARLDK